MLIGFTGQLVKKIPSLKLWSHVWREKTRLLAFYGIGKFLTENFNIRRFRHEG